MYPNTFYRVSIKALIRDKDDKVLVIKENQDSWSLPGGGLDHSEEPEDAIRRELKEELAINNTNIIGVEGVTTLELKLKKAWLLWIVYEVKLESTKFIFGDGVTDVKFIDVNEFEFSDDIFEQQVYKVAKLS